MALPKRRHSHSRKNKRRSQYKAKKIQYVTCPKCKSPRLPHRVCPNCGHYKNTTVITHKEKEKKS